MADLNALIAQGYQTPAPPDPFAQYAKMQQLNQGEQTNQLNRMKMQEYERGIQEQNALRGVVSKSGFDPMNPTHQAEAYAAAPTLAPKYIESALTTKESAGKITAADIKAKTDKRTLLGQAHRDISGNPSDAQITAHLEDVLASSIFSPTEKAMVQNSANELLALPYEQRQMKLSTQGASAADLKPQVVSPGSGLVPMGATAPVYTQPFAPKEVALTPLAKLQNELAALPPNDSRRAQYIDAIRKETQFAPQASTTINMPPQEKSEQSGRGTLLVEQYKDVSKAAKNAVSTLPALETQAAILDAGFKTGFGTDTQKVGASLLGALGVPEAAKFATDSQKFLGAAQQAVLQKQLEQKGPQTESDAQRISQTGAQLGNTVEANRFMIDVAKSQLKRDIEQRNFYDGWWKKNKTYDGAEDAWFNGEGGKSLFDRPELKAYKQSTAAPVAAPAAATQGTGGFKYLGVVPTESKK